MDIKNLNSYIENSGNFTVLGCPKGVGVTTFFCEKAANSIFFNENMTYMFLADNIRDKLDIEHKIQKEYKKFNEYGLTKDGNLLYEESENGSVVIVIDYAFFNLSELHGLKVDHLIIDRDWGDEKIKAFIDHCLGSENYEKITVCTYDTADSIYYSIADDFKVRLTSSHNQRLIKKIKNSENISDINNYRLLYGTFEYNT